MSTTPINNPMTLRINKFIDIDSGKSVVGAYLKDGTGKAIAQISLHNEFMAGDTAKNIRDISLSDDVKLAVRFAADCIKENHPELSGEVKVSIRPQVGLISNQGEINHSDIPLYKNDSDHSLKKTEIRSGIVLSHITKKNYNLKNDGKTIDFSTQINDAAKKAKETADENAIAKGEIYVSPEVNKYLDIEANKATKLKNYVIKDFSKSIDDDNLQEVKQEVKQEVEQEVKQEVEQEVEPKLLESVMSVHHREREVEHPTLGSSAEITGLTKRDTPLDIAKSPRNLQIDKSKANPLDIASSADVEARIHRHSDNRKLLISMIIEAITAAVVLGGGLSQGGDIQDSADAADGNADSAEAQAQELAANEENMVSKAGKEVHDAVSNKLTAEAFKNPANQQMNTDDTTGESTPSGELLDTITTKIETQAQAAQETAEATAQQMIEDKISQLNAYADDQRAEADALNKEAKVISGTSGSAGIGMVMAAIWSGTKLTVNRRHNSQAEENLQGMPGVFDARHKGNGIPQPVETKA